MLEKQNDPIGLSFADFAISFLIIVVLYGASISGLLSPIKLLLQQAIYPISQSLRESAQAIKNEYATLLQARSLKRQADTLREENTQLRASLSQMILFKEENRQLYLQLQQKISAEYKTAIARIISTNPTLTVFVEDNESVKQDQIVVVENNVVGFIDSIEQNIARVNLLKDLRNAVPVTILNTQKIEIMGRGMLLGEYGTNITVDQITQDVKLNSGYHIALSPTKNSNNSLHIGTIAEIIKRDSDLFQKAYVTQDIQLDKLHSVFIITGEK